MGKSTFKGWRSLKRSKPPIDKLVEIRHMITGSGAPEREGWESLGRLRSQGMFTVDPNLENTVDHRPPTHWRELSAVKELNQEYPELVKEYSAMSKKDLLEQICREVLDLLAMEERVQVFMSECTVNMSKTNYTLSSIRSLISEKQEQDIVDFCYWECNDGQTDAEIAEAIRERAKDK